MAHRNRVTPYGEIVVSTLRGAWMGNRGCIHRGYDIVRPWNGKRWIICALEFKGWVAPKWAPGRWTELFFHDEAIAFAAGHRPCALCRRADYLRYRAALGLTSADAIDARLHGERRDGRRKRLHAMPWRELPIGTFVDAGGAPYAVLADRLRHWDAASGYGDECTRPTRGDANVITPPASVQVLLAGYAVQLAA
ncbi:MAG: hypothetical protein QOF71_3020 [Candidatus Eremiobacteraeota bacterium]|jgi:hypothetical protein|nr:hypothetical protein [Candidatus Eremiobacteraeota bacterium]